MGLSHKNSARKMTPQNETRGGSYLERGLKWAQLQIHHSKATHTQTHTATLASVAKLDFFRIDLSALSYFTRKKARHFDRFEKT